MTPTLQDALARIHHGEAVVAFVTLQESLELVQAGATVEPLTDWETAGPLEWAWVSLCAAA